MSHNKSHLPTGRREFLRLVGGSALSLAAGQTLIGCGSGNGSSSPSTGSGNNSTSKLNPKAVVLPDDGSLRITAVDANSLTLSGKVPALAPGAVMVSGAGEGLLRTVNSTIVSGSSTVVQTSAATLEDLFQDAHIVLSKRLGASDFATITPSYPGISVSSASSSGKVSRDVQLEVNFSDVKINDTLELSGSATLDVGIDFACEVGFFHLDYLKFAPTITSDLSIKASGTFKADPVDVHILVLYGNPIDIQAGFAPIVFVPIVNVYLHIEGSLEIGAELSLTATTTLQAGAEYHRGQGATKIASLQKQFSPGAMPNLYASFKVDVSPLKPDIELKLYGITGPYVNFELPKLEFEYKLQTQPPQTEINGTASIRAAAGAKFDVLSKIHLDYEIAAIEESYQFLHQVHPFDGGINLGIQ